MCAYWKTGYRKVNGKRRKVRKLVTGGVITAVRIANRPHYTDKTAKKYGIAHVKRYVNFPNAAARTDYKRSRR